MKNRIGLIVLGVILSTAILLNDWHQEVHHLVSASDKPQETVYLTQQAAVEVGKTAQLGLQISSTIVDQIRLQFPADAEFMGISEELDPQLEVVFEASSQQLIITTNKRKMLDEESETYNSNLYVKFKSDSSGDYLFKTLINNPQILTEEVLVSVQEVETLRTTQEITPRLVTNVSTWSQFNAALANSSVSEINLTNNIRATSSPTNVTRSLRINGHGYQLDLDNRTLILGNVSAPQSLTFNNLILAGRGSGSRVNSSTSNSARWTLNLESLSFGNSIGTQNIFNLLQGRIAFTGGSSNLVSSVTDTSTSRGMLTAKFLDVTNGAQVNARLGGGFFFSNVSGTETTIDQGGQLVVHSETGLLFNQTNPSSFSVDGQNSLLQGTGNRQSAGDNGTLVSMIGPNSKIEVNNGGKIDIFATGTPAMLLNSQNGRFSVSNGSSLNLTSSGGANDRAATLRFRVNGGQTFLAESNSEINIRKIRGGTAHSTATTAPAVRMRYPNNRFIVNSGGKVSIYTEGSGQPQDPGGFNRNQGILYTEGDNSSFELSGEGSVVQIDADFGAAIDTHNQTASIRANEGTTFIARGRTASEGSGIFNTSRSTITLDKVRFFDFRNERPGGGNIFDVSGGSRLESLNSNLNVWRKGSHLDGDPDHDWPLFSYALSGTNFNQVDESNDTNFTEVYSQGGLGATAFSRMSGNNIPPVIDELRQPTNADKFVFGHATVPVGTEGGRDAWTDEVFVKVKITKASGESQEVIAPTYGMNNNNPGLVVYDEEPRAGLFKGGTDKAEFLKRGDMIQVIKAWRGELNEESDRNIFSRPEDIQTPQRMVEDVTPPASLVLATTEVTNGTKQLGGTIDLFDERDQEELEMLKIFIKVNQEFLRDEQGELVSQIITTESSPSGSTKKNWLINLPRYLDLSEEIVEVYAKDLTELKRDPTSGELLVTNPPATYTIEPDGVPGNLSVSAVNYEAYQGYHDALLEERFQSAPSLEIEDVLPSPPVVTKTVSSDTTDGQGAEISQVGSQLTYSITIENSDEDNSRKVLRKTIFEDTLPLGVDFSLETSDLRINDALVHQERVDYAEERRLLTIELGDLEPGDVQTIVFKATVNREAVGSVIENQALGIGETPRETPFIPGPLNPDSTYETVQGEGRVSNPGGEVGGLLILESAPKLVDFGSHLITDYHQQVGVNQQDISDPLVVDDTRKGGGTWSVTAQVVMEMTNGLDVKKGSLKYLYKDQLLTLGSSAQEIYQAAENNPEKRHVITDNWGREVTAEGLKFQLEAVDIPRTEGFYQGVIRWTLRDTIE